MTSFIETVIDSSCSLTVFFFSFACQVASKGDYFLLNDDLGTKSGGNSSSSDSDSDDGKYLIHHHQRIAVIWST